MLLSLIYNACFINQTPNPGLALHLSTPHDPIGIIKHHSFIDSCNYLAPITNLAYGLILFATNLGISGILHGAFSWDSSELVGGTIGCSKQV